MVFHFGNGHSPGTKKLVAHSVIDIHVSGVGRLEFFHDLQDFLFGCASMTLEANDDNFMN